MLKVNPLARWETPSLVFLVFFGLWQRRWRSWIVFISPRHGHSPRREVRLRDNVGHNSCCVSLLSTKISIAPRKGIFEPLKHLYYKESSPLTNKNISVYKKKSSLYSYMVAKDDPLDSLWQLESRNLERCGPLPFTVMQPPFVYCACDRLLMRTNFSVSL